MHAIVQDFRRMLGNFASLFLVVVVDEKQLLVCRTHAGANARETRRCKSNPFITSNDASSVARNVQCAPRGVAQIKWDILRHVIGEPTVGS